MKKTIAAIAMIASANAVAFAPPGLGGPAPKVTKVCLSTHPLRDESIVAGCDESANNIREERKILENGCAAQQVALTVLGDSPVNSCMPPGAVQL